MTAGVVAAMRIGLETLEPLDPVHGARAKVVTASAGQLGAITMTIAMTSGSSGGHQDLRRRTIGEATTSGRMMVGVGGNRTTLTDGRRTVHSLSRGIPK